MKQEIRIGEEYKLEIISIGSKGDGIAKINGLSVIIKGNIEVGQVYNVKITSTHEKFAFAEVI